MLEYIEIGGHTKSPVGKRLSNFFPRPFTMGAVRCGGMEGFLQSLKCHDAVTQTEIAALSGIAAKRAGQAHNAWKETQLLFWQGEVYNRSSRGYLLLITRAYDALFHQQPKFRRDLAKLGTAQIWHSIGNPDMRATTLTETEMLYQLERLRRVELQWMLKDML